MTNAGHSPVIAWPALAKASRHVPIVLAGRGLSKIPLCLACCCATGNRRFRPVPVCVEVAIGPIHVVI